MKVKELIKELYKLPPSLDVALSPTPINDIALTYRFATNDVYEIREIIQQEDPRYGDFCNILITQRNKKSVFGGIDE